MCERLMSRILYFCALYVHPKRNIASVHAPKWDQISECKTSDGFYGPGKMLQATCFRRQLSSYCRRGFRSNL